MRLLIDYDINYTHAYDIR